MFIARTRSRWFELFGESQPSATRTPRASSSGIRPCAPTPRPPLAAVTGHIVTAAPVRAMQSISPSRSRAQRERTLGPSTPSASSTRWDSGAARLVLLPAACAPLPWCHREPGPRSSTTRLSACSSSRCTSPARTASPRAHPAVEAAVPLVDEDGGARGGLAIASAAAERRLAIVTASPRIHAHARVRVGLQARIGNFVEPGSSRHTVPLRTSSKSPAASVILLLLGHRQLQREHMLRRLPRRRERPHAHQLRASRALASFRRRRSPLKHVFALQLAMTEGGGVSHVAAGDFGARAQRHRVSARPGLDEISRCVPAAYADAGVRVILARPSPIARRRSRSRRYAMAEAAARTAAFIDKWNGRLDGRVRAWAMPFSPRRAAPSCCSAQACRRRTRDRLTLHHGSGAQARESTRRAAPKESHRVPRGARRARPNVLLAHALGSTTARSTASRGRARPSRCVRSRRPRRSRVGAQDGCPSCSPAACAWRSAATRRTTRTTSTWCAR